MKLKEKHAYNLEKCYKLFTNFNHDQENLLLSYKNIIHIHLYPYTHHDFLRFVREYSLFPCHR